MLKIVMRCLNLLQLLQPGPMNSGTRSGTSSRRGLYHTAKQPQSTESCIFSQLQRTVTFCQKVYLICWISDFFCVPVRVLPMLTWCEWATYGAEWRYWDQVKVVRLTDDWEEKWKKRKEKINELRDNKKILFYTHGWINYYSKRLLMIVMMDLDVVVVVVVICL